LPQSGNESFYPKRTPKDSELDINKTIQDQFNLLRIVDNDNYPAFFELEGQRYRLTVELDSGKGGQLIDFVDLTNNELLDVLEMRNNLEVRKWMYTQDEISQEQHFSFIRKLTDDTKNQYFMVKQEKAILGVIYFNNINFEKQTAVFGLYANLFYSKLGVGKLLLELVQFYTKMILRINRLKLEVIAKNAKAVNLYSKYGFIESGRFQKNGFEVLSMEKEL
jgi:UDP-4-amino-4,6-dideoxy-N-acetyl-beta-L-altrosamine N-acetyltransferase